MENVEGEGEEMFAELATKIEKKENIKDILNLTLKVNGKVYRSGTECKLDDLPTGDNIYGENIGLRRPQTNMAKTLLPPDYTIYDDKRFWKKNGWQGSKNSCNGVK